MSKAVDSSALLRKVLLLAGLAFALWATWKVSSDEPADKPVAERAEPTQRRGAAKPAAALAAPKLDWPARGEHPQPIADLFDQPVQPRSAASAPAAPVAAPVPVLRLKYMGRLSGADNDSVFLADAQDKVIQAKVGQPLPDGWQLTAVEPKQLVFRHEASGQEQTMTIGALQ